MILLDTSGLLSAIDQASPQRIPAREALEVGGVPRILSPFVLAELDCMIGRNVGPAAQQALLEEVEAGTYELALFDAADVWRARGVIETYPDLHVGLADASIVVLAGRYGTDRVLTFDHRHFRVLRTPAGNPFRLLPADA